MNKNSSEENKNTGITQEYTGNRNLWDDTKAKHEYLDKTFDGKKAIEIDNNILHRSHTAAKNKYKGNSAKHKAEVDHRVSIKELHERSKNNRFLSNDDLKDIANDEVNFQILSKSENASKGADSDHSILLHAELQKKFAERTLKNINNEYVIKPIEKLKIYSENNLRHDHRNNDFLSKFQEYKNNSEISEKENSITSAVNNYVKNTSKQIVSKSVDTIKQSASKIVIESIDKLLLEGESLEQTFSEIKEEIVQKTENDVSEILLNELKKETFEFIKNSDNQSFKELEKQIAGIAGNNQLIRIVSFVKANSESLIKYVNGEISGEELSEEILLNGLITGASVVISSFCPIPFIGPLIASFTANTAEIILSIRYHLNDYLIKETIITNLSKEAENEMEKRRTVFHDMVQKEFDKWDKTSTEAFDQMISFSFEDNFNLEKIIGGLDKLLDLFGEKAAFHSVEEWERQLDTPLNLCF